MKLSQLAELVALPGRVNQPVLIDVATQLAPTDCLFTCMTHHSFEATIANAMIWECYMKNKISKSLKLTNFPSARDK